MKNKLNIFARKGQNVNMLDKLKNSYEFSKIYYHLVK